MASNINSKYQSQCNDHMAKMTRNSVMKESMAAASGIKRKYHQLAAKSAVSIISSSGGMAWRDARATPAINEHQQRGENVSSNV